MAHPLQGSASISVDDAEAGGMFSLSSPHGAATWLAIISLVAVMFVVGRGQSMFRALLAAFAFIGLIGAAQIAFGHVAHSWTLTHPESPIAVGLAFDLGGL